MIKHPKMLIFDFETNGLDPQINQAIELGAAQYIIKDGRYTLNKEINLLIKCPTPLPELIKNLTNITDEMLEKEGVSESLMFNELSQLIDDETLLVAYNIAFDLSFLIALYKKYENPQFILKNDILDIMTVYKDRYAYPHKLDAAVNTYNVEVINTHRALDDVKATAAVMAKMYQQKPNLDIYVNKITAHYKYGYSGPRLAHITPVSQYGGRFEIEKLK